MIRLVVTLIAAALVLAATAQPRSLPCRAAWLAPKCDRAFADPERYRHMIRVCREAGFEPSIRSELKEGEWK